MVEWKEHPSRQAGSDPATEGDFLGGELGASRSAGPAGLTQEKGWSLLRGPSASHITTLCSSLSIGVASKKSSVLRTVRSRERSCRMGHEKAVHGIINVLVRESVWSSLLQTCYFRG